MGEELRTVYGDVPSVVRGVFRDGQKGFAAGDQLKAMGLAHRDVDVIQVTAPEVRKVARPLLEIIGLKKSKEKAARALKFEVGEVVVLVRLREWAREQTEAALKELGADELEYFGPPGEGGESLAHVAPARIGG